MSFDLVNVLKSTGYQDTPGMFTWLPLGAIDISIAYQRQPSPQRVSKMAKTWSWAACGVITVVHADEPGKYYALDGFHRVSAARKVGTIASIPCLAFRLTPQQQAAVFVAINTSRKALTPLEKYNAQLAVQDDVSTNMAALFTKYNIRIGRPPADYSGVSFGCIRCLRSIAERDFSAFENILDVFHRNFVKHKNNPGCGSVSPAEWTVSGIDWLFQRAENGKLLKNKIIEKPYYAIHEAARRAIVIQGRESAKIAASGILDYLNNGLRTKIKVEGLGE